MTPPPLPSNAPRTAGRIIGSISCTLGWAALHYVLYYLMAVSGFLVDLFLAFVKMIMVPGAARGGMPIGMDTWDGTLLIGLILAGTAGIPLGLSILYTERRRRFRLLFWLLLLLGVCFEVAALYQLCSHALSLPSS